MRKDRQETVVLPARACGGFWGGVTGAVVGAGVGAINPFGASAAGAFVGGVVSSLAGQVLGNAVSQQPLLSNRSCFGDCFRFWRFYGVTGNTHCCCSGVVGSRNRNKPSDRR